MILSLTPAELQAIAELLKDAILPMLDSASQSQRGNMRMLTIDDVAENANVVRKTVENWIAGGKLRAVADWGSDERPMYRVSEAAYWEFYDNNAVLLRNVRSRPVGRKRKTGKLEVGGRTPVKRGG